ncbi:glycosyltransferase family 4 protein [Pseudoalteromonas piscicida]|uniref:glycosyltransferase family 4 protein n=1 Tax=Pseudoalteromonas piscicida TaxID=43662 RepID=UPI003C799C87
MKFLVLAASPKSLVNFRGPLLKLIRSKGWDVKAMASNASEQELRNIKELGIDYEDCPINRSGMSIVEDLKTLLFFRRAIKLFRPDCILAYTIKPIIWGGIASRLYKGVSFNAMITGLGYGFQKGGVVKNIFTSMLKLLYRIALRNSNAVIFQNVDNMQYFISQGIVSESKCYLVNGSGVDLDYFEKSSVTNEPNFLMIARLLKDKGVFEYIDAAKRVKKEYPKAQFSLLGPPDKSPNGIDINEIKNASQLGYINYLGSALDVRPYLKNANIFVLPSYHEGLPRTVLEAMAMGRPVLTTNVPGCKDTVEQGCNGWLVEKQDSTMLAERMIWFLENPDKWESMGNHSFQSVVSKYDVNKVNVEMLKIMEVK